MPGFGESLPLDMVKWLEGLPDAIRAALHRFGLLDGQRLAAGRTLIDHVDDWRAFLLAKGNTEKHADLVSSRAKKVIDGCKFTYHSDAAAARVIAHLEDLRKGEQGISAQTSNFHLQAARSFCRGILQARAPRCVSVACRHGRRSA